jgi:hypothetical protein
MGSSSKSKEKSGKKSKGKPKFVETYFNRNYVDPEDVEEFMDVTFSGTEYDWEVHTVLGSLLMQS